MPCDKVKVGSGGCLWIPARSCTICILCRPLAAWRFTTSTSLEEGAGTWCPTFCYLLLSRPVLNLDVSYRNPSLPNRGQARTFPQRGPRESASAPARACIKSITDPLFLPAARPYRVVAQLLPELPQTSPTVGRPKEASLRGKLS